MKRLTPTLAAVLLAVSGPASASERAPYVPHYDINGRDAATGTIDTCHADPIPSPLAGGYCETHLAEEARLQRASCPTLFTDPFIQAMPAARFEKCWALTDAAAEGSFWGDYHIANGVRLQIAADAAWERKLEHCRHTPGCVVVEGRIEQ
jgi:hypothetical protein